MTQAWAPIDPSIPTRPTSSRGANVALLSLFGTFSLVADGRQISFPTRKAECLLAYMVLRRGKPILRRCLAGTLWPDSDDIRAARNLNTTLWRVKRTLESAGVSSFSFHSDQARVWLRPENVEVDVVTFQDLIASVHRLPGERAFQRLIRAEEIYCGDFLEGLDDEWIELERSRIRNQYLSSLRTLVNAFCKAGDSVRGLVFARKLVDADPLNEEAHRAIMQLSFLSGDRTGALVQYDLLRSILRSELEIEPSQECTDLWLQIKSFGPSRIVTLRR